MEHGYVVPGSPPGAFPWKAGGTIGIQTWGLMTGDWLEWPGPKWQPPLHNAMTRKVKYKYVPRCEPVGVACAINVSNA